MLDDNGVEQVLSLQELPENVSLSEQNNQLIQQELQDETSSIDSLIAWIEDPRTLEQITTPHDNSMLTELMNTHF